MFILANRDRGRQYNFAAYRNASDSCVAEWSSIGFKLIHDETDPRHPWFVRLCFRFAAAESAAASPSPGLTTADIIKFNEGYWNALMQLMWAPHLYERAALILREVFGNPFRTRPTGASWLTPEFKNLAERIYDARAFHRLPELADALKHAGCNDRELIEHCAAPFGHAPGCWALDLVLGKTTSVTVSRRE